jgi:hypothetical protein
MTYACESVGIRGDTPAQGTRSPAQGLAGLALLAGAFLIFARILARLRTAGHTLARLPIPLRWQPLATAAGGIPGDGRPLLGWRETPAGALDARPGGRCGLFF